MRKRKVIVRLPSGYGGIRLFDFVVYKRLCCYVFCSVTIQSPYDFVAFTSLG